MRRTRIGGIARICVRFAVDLRPNCGCLRTFSPDLRPNCGCLRTFFARFAVVCRRGVAPIDDVLPLQGAIPFKPSRGGVPRVPFTSFTLPWAEIPLPLQGAAGSKPPNVGVD